MDGEKELVVCSPPVDCLLKQEEESKRRGEREEREKGEENQHSHSVSKQDPVSSQNKINGNV